MSGSLWRGLVLCEMRFHGPSHVHQVVKLLLSLSPNYLPALQVPSRCVHHPQDLRHPQEQRELPLPLEQGSRRPGQEGSPGPRGSQARGEGSQRRQEAHQPGQERLGQNCCSDQGQGQGPGPSHRIDLSVFIKCWINDGLKSTLHIQRLLFLYLCYRHLVVFPVILLFIWSIEFGIMSNTCCKWVKFSLLKIRTFTWLFTWRKRINWETSRKLSL